MAATHETTTSTEIRAVEVKSTKEVHEMSSVTPLRPEDRGRTYRRQRTYRLAEAFELQTPVFEPTCGEVKSEPAPDHAAAEWKRRKAFLASIDAPTTSVDAQERAKIEASQANEPLWREQLAYAPAFRWNKVGTRSNGRNIWQLTRSRRYVPFSENEVVDTDERFVAEATRRYESLQADVAEGFTDPESEGYSIRWAMIHHETGIREDEVSADDPWAWNLPSAMHATVTPWQLAQGRNDLAWFLRDEREIDREKLVARLNDAPLKVTGDHWIGSSRQRSKGVRTGNVTLHTTGAIAEKAWLDAQIAQLRIDYRDLARDAQRKTGRREVRGFAQLAAIERQVASMRHRHNFRRYVEALGTDPLADDRKADFDAALAKFDERRRAANLSYEKANAKLAERVASTSDRWIGVEGLIAA